MGASRGHDGGGGVCRECGTTLPAVARFCPGCGAPAAPPKAGTERKVATVVFADLVGSAGLGEGDPERMRAALERFYQAMAEEIGAAGGTLEKFAGDAVMAVFGAPAAQEDHAERALHTALAMRRRLAELFGREHELRIGVNSGEVAVGAPYASSSFVSGEAVTVAARLEQAAQPGEILAGERTAAAAGGAFEFGPPRTVRAKGKPGGIACRTVLRALSLARPRGLSGLGRAFVGRETDLDLLRAAYRRTAGRREPSLVTITGEAGVGKTRLARELWAWLGGESPVPLRRTGRCLPYGRAITYWPLGEVVKEHFGILERDGPAEIRAALAEHEALALTLGLEAEEGLHPLAVRERLHGAWVEFLGQLAGERPVVVLLEDLHWAEEPLLELVERLLREVPGPLFLVCTARPELLARRPAWGGGWRDATSIGLGPLTREDTDRLLEALLGRDLPPPLRTLILDRAEGNPFFLEELVGTLVDRGVLRREAGSWQATELPGDFVVPDSVQAVLAARIDLLDPAGKAALQAASVMGRVFWAGALRFLLDSEEPDLRSLEERDLVRRRAVSSIAGEREFAFKHAVTREVAYAGLGKTTRARLHARFAAWLEQSGEVRDEHAPIVAHHYAEAVRPEDADLAWAGHGGELERLRAKAVAWLRRAGDVAVSRYEIGDALALYRRALELEADTAEQALLWRAIGHAHALGFEGESFWTAMQRSLDACHDPATCAETLAELAFQTTARSGMWRRRPDRELVAGWIERACELADPESPARVKALIARSYWDQPGAAEAAREASEIAERLGDVELRSYAWDARRLAAFRAAGYEEALSWAERRLGMLGLIDDPDHVTSVYEGAIPVYVALGRFGRARELAALHDAVAARLTAHHRLHGVAYFLQVEELAGEWETARALSERTEEAVEANLSTPCVLNSRSLLVCALASAHLGSEAEARRLERRADELGMEGYGPTLGAPRLQLALLRGDVDEAERLLEEPIDSRGRNWYYLAAASARLDALAVLGDRERLEVEAAPHLVPHTYLEPFALRALGRVRGDRSLVDLAAARFAAMGLSWHAARTA